MLSLRVTLKAASAMKSRITPGSAFDLKGYVSQLDWSSFCKKPQPLAGIHGTGLQPVVQGRGSIAGLGSTATPMNKRILKPSQV